MQEQPELLDGLLDEAARMGEGLASMDNLRQLAVTTFAEVLHNLRKVRATRVFSQVSSRKWLCVLLYLRCEPGGVVLEICLELAS